MNLLDFKPGMVGAGTALGASLCCVLPMTIVLLGLGSGAFMAVTMQFRWILYPIGVAGLATAWWLLYREKRRCNALACRMTGGRTNLLLVAASSLLMGLVTYVDFFLVQM